MVGAKDKLHALRLAGIIDARLASLAADGASRATVLLDDAIELACAGLAATDLELRTRNAAGARAIDAWSCSHFVTVFSPAHRKVRATAPCII